jgi:hypothetical protein
MVQRKDFRLIACFPRTKVPRVFPRNDSPIISVGRRRRWRGSTALGMGTTRLRRAFQIMLLIPFPFPRKDRPVVRYRAVISCPSSFNQRGSGCGKVPHHIDRNTPKRALLVGGQSIYPVQITQAVRTRDHPPAVPIFLCVKALYRPHGIA